MLYVIIGIVFGGSLAFFCAGQYLKKCIFIIVAYCVCIAIFVLLKNISKEWGIGDYQEKIGQVFLLLSFFVSTSIGKKIFISKTNDTEGCSKNKTKPNTGDKNNTVNKFVTLFAVITLTIFSLYQICFSVINGSIKPIFLKDRGDILYSEDPILFLVWFMIHWVCIFIYIGGYFLLYGKKQDDPQE
jgi:hypothetical protein